MNVLRKLLVLLIPLVLVTACATTKETATTGSSTETAPLSTTTETAPTAEGTAASEAAGGAESMGMSGESGFQGDELANPDSLLAKRTIYFDFDRTEIKQEFLPVLEAHGQYLAEHPNVRVSLQGNTDERGTREYNMALGERRAKAVKRYLAAQGASFSQMEVISYGEERPVAQGHDEAAWALNRRVDIVYSGH